MRSFTDQAGREVIVSDIPRRIVSLVPSQTELLYDLGLGDKVTGITKFCVHPEEWFRTKPRVGGTKTVDIEKVLSLKPDLVIANREENVKEQIEELAGKVPVWVSDVNNLEDAYNMIAETGKITGHETQADQLVSKIREAFQATDALSNKTEPVPCAYLIWKDPYMTVGGDTFIHDMLTKCGLNNVFGNRNRYPQLSAGELKTAGCRLVLLSSEPYPFKEKHAEEIRDILPDAKVLLADGEMFSWYGSRLLKAAPYLLQLQATLQAALK